MKKCTAVILILLLMLSLSVPAFAEEEEANWSTAYAEVLAGVQDPGTEAGFLLYDIEKDGLPELIVRTGSYEAEYAGTVYTCADGTAAAVGEIGLGHTGCFSDPGENGFLLWTAQMGAASLFRYSLENGQLVSNELFEETLDIQNDPDADYTPVESCVPGARFLEWYDLASDPQAVYDEVLNTLSAESILLSAEDAGDQLNLIFSVMDSVSQDPGEMAWQYTVTDLDRNGRLECLAASEHDQSHETTLLAWEVSEDFTSLVPCTVNPAEDTFFPDIISDSADTFYDEGSGTWHYLFYDHRILSDTEAATVKYSVMLRNGILDCKEHAMQHVDISGSQAAVSWFDAGGNDISQDEYNAAGVDAFGGRRKSSSNFAWIPDNWLTLTQLTDSYAVFTGEKAVPNVSKAAASSPAPTAQPVPVPDTPFLMITDNPTNEYHSEGETAWFVATANVWTSLAWTFVGPNGVEYSVEDMGYYFPDSSIGGADGTTLSISNVTESLDGFGAYCTFWYNGQTAQSSTAWLYVSSQPTPPPDGEESGTVIDAAMSTVTIQLDDGTQVQVLRDICYVDGGLDIGCRCDVYYEGYEINNETVYEVYIYGTEPEPTYGSMGGTITDAMMSTVTIQLDNGDVVQTLRDYVNVVNGSLSVGCGCTVYYNGDYPTTDSIYSVEVYGWDEAEDDAYDPNDIDADSSDWDYDDSSYEEES